MRADGLSDGYSVKADGGNDGGVGVVDVAAGAVRKLASRRLRPQVARIKTTRAQKFKSFLSLSVQTIHTGALFKRTVTHWQFPPTYGDFSLATLTTLLRCLAHEHIQNSLRRGQGKPVASKVQILQQMFRFLLGRRRRNLDG